MSIQEFKEYFKKKTGRDLQTSDITIKINDFDIEIVFNVDESMDALASINFIVCFED